MIFNIIHIMSKYRLRDIGYQLVYVILLTEFQRTRSHARRPV
jgi:hypothetical protein